MHTSTEVPQFATFSDMKRVERKMSKPTASKEARYIALYERRVELLLEGERDAELMKRLERMERGLDAVGELREIARQRVVNPW